MSRHSHAALLLEGLVDLGVDYIFAISAPTTCR